METQEIKAQMEQKEQMNQEMVQKNEQVEFQGIKLPIYLYHFPDGSKGLMIHLSKDVDSAEVIPVHYPLQPEV